jgi:lysophospholipase L1-like esterase
MDHVVGAGYLLALNPKGMFSVYRLGFTLIPSAKYSLSPVGFLMPPKGSAQMSYRDRLVSSLYSVSSRYAALCLALVVLFVGDAAASGFALSLDLSPGSRVAFERDSLIYGQDETQAGRLAPVNGGGQGRSGSPLPEHLGELLEHRIEIDNRGDRTIDGLQRWRHVEEVAVVFLMYGTIDAMNFASHSGGTLSLPDYATNLRELVNRRRSAGTKVILTTSPPIGVLEWDVRVSPYRTEAKCVAAELDVPILDTSEVLSGIADKWADGLHLNERSLNMLAQFLSGHIHVTKSKELSHAP